MSKLSNWQTPVFITFLLLGLLITIQFRSQQDYLRDLPQRTTDDLYTILSKTSDKKNELEKELQNLEWQQNLLSSDVSADETVLNQMREDITRQKMALGTVPAEGSGVTITIESDLSITEYDLIDIINELWNSKAEAIAVNERRITSWSKIYWSEQAMALTIDGGKVTFPCTIRAIGDPERLQSGLELLGGVLDNLKFYNIYPTVEKKDNLELPAAGQYTAKHLSPKAD